MKYNVYVSVSTYCCYTVDADSTVEAEEKAKEMAYDENWNVNDVDVFDIEEVTED